LQRRLFAVHRGGKNTRRPVDAADAQITTLYVRKPAQRDAEYEFGGGETKRRREIARQLEAESVLISANAQLARRD